MTAACVASTNRLKLILFMSCFRYAKKLIEPSDCDWAFVFMRLGEGDRAPECYGRIDD